MTSQLHIIKPTLVNLDIYNHPRECLSCDQTSVQHTHFAGTILLQSLLYIDCKMTDCKKKVQKSHQTPSSFEGGDEKPQEDTLKGRPKMDNSFKNLFGLGPLSLKALLKLNKKGKDCNPQAFVR